MDITNLRIGHGKHSIEHGKLAIEYLRMETYDFKKHNKWTTYDLWKNKKMDNIKLQQGAQCDRNQI